MVKTVEAVYFLFAALFFAASAGGIFVNSLYYGAPIWLMLTFFAVFFFVKPRKMKIGSVLVLSAVLRLAAAFIFPAPLFSDYLKYHETAVSLVNNTALDINYAAAFPHTLTYSALISLVYKVFGAAPQIIYTINAFIGALTVYMIYKCACILSSNKEKAVYAALLYGIFPASIFYTSLLATEIPYTLLFFTVIYAVLKEKSAAAGIAAAVMNLIRPTGLIFAVAYLIYIMFYEENRKNKVLKLFSAAAAYILITGAGSFGLEKISGRALPAAPFGYSLYVGMNSESMGRWNERDYSLAMSMADNSEKMHTFLGNEAWKRFTDNGLEGSLRLFASKFALTWGSGSLICSYMSHNPVFDEIKELFICWAEGFHLFIAYLCFASAYKYMKKTADKHFMFPMLTVLGMAALCLFTETMERYVYSPFAAVILLTERNYCMFENLMADINAVLERDPASKSRLMIFLLSPGVKALRMHRRANFFWRHKMKFTANAISMHARKKTGIEIHPGATIGKGVLIDHGMGVVIGETAVVGDNCTIYQNVTLGGTGKDTGKRHPTVGNNVLIGAGAKVLGPFIVGDNSKIAANAVVLSEVPPDSTCVGVPARVVKQNNKRIHDCTWQMDQTHIPDPVSQEICKIIVRIEQLENEKNKVKEK